MNIKDMELSMSMMLIADKVVTDLLGYRVKVGKYNDTLAVYYRTLEKQFKILEFYIKNYIDKACNDMSYEALVKNIVHSESDDELARNIEIARKCIKINELRIDKYSVMESSTYVNLYDCIFKNRGLLESAGVVCFYFSDRADKLEDNDDTKKLINKIDEIGRSIDDAYWKLMGTMQSLQFAKSIIDVTNRALVLIEKSGVSDDMLCNTLVEIDKFMSNKLRFLGSSDELEVIAFEKNKIIPFKNIIDGIAMFLADLGQCDYYEDDKPYLLKLCVALQSNTICYNVSVASQIVKLY